MCSRLALYSRSVVVTDTFNLKDYADITPRYNIGPRQPVLVVGRRPDGGRGFAVMEWGFLPRWEEDPDHAPRPTVARLETVATHGLFRDSFRDRRCVVAADGWYEWWPQGQAQHPYFFRMKDRKPFGIAAVWDRWKGPDRTPPVLSVAVLAMKVNLLVRRVHDRMPVTIGKNDFDQWLDLRQTDSAAAAGLFRPCPDSWMQYLPVCERVNGATADGPECLASADGGKAGDDAEWVG